MRTSSTSKIMIKIVLAALFLTGFAYLLLPGPTSISQFPKLPGSVKSQETGDTIQIPNVAAYFSDHRRGSIIPFYRAAFRDSYCKSYFLGLPNPLCFIPPVHLNHPPEEAFLYIRDQQKSTYLEQFTYPFRESFFVNGYEPYDSEGRPFNWESVPLLVDGTIYQTKTNLRLYTNSVYARVLVYLAIWFLGYLMYKLIWENWKKI